MEDKAKKNEQKKLSYEELQQVAGDLSQQNQKMYAEIQRLREILENKSFDQMSFFLSMLFKVMEHPEKYKEEFVVWAAENIQSGLVGFANAIMPKPEEEKKADEAE